MMDVETDLHSAVAVFTQTPYQFKTSVSDFHSSTFQAKELKDRNKRLLYFRWLMLFSGVFVTYTDIHMLNLQVMQVMHFFYSAFGREFNKYSFFQWILLDMNYPSISYINIQN